MEVTRKVKKKCKEERRRKIFSFYCNKFDGSIEKGPIAEKDSGTRTVRFTMSRKKGGRKIGKKKKTFFSSS